VQANLQPAWEIRQPAAGVVVRSFPRRDRWRAKSAPSGRAPLVVPFIQSPFGLANRRTKGGDQVQGENRGGEENGDGILTVNNNNNNNNRNNSLAD